MNTKKYTANFYIDGFNFYMGIRELEKKLRAAGDPLPSNKVNYWTLAGSLLHGNKYVGVGSVKYFSAYTHTNVPRRKRHEEYVANLTAAGVDIIMGKHKKVWRECQATCRETYETYEEKETDVRIALEIMNDAHAGRFDRAYIMSADSDLVPVVEAVRREFPKLQIWSVSPPNRGTRSKALRAACCKGIGTGAHAIRNNLF